jgi:hypothetical protein
MMKESRVRFCDFGLLDKGDEVAGLSLLPNFFLPNEGALATSVELAISLFCSESRFKAR